MLKWCFRIAIILSFLATACASSSPATEVSQPLAAIAVPTTRPEAAEVARPTAVSPSDSGEAEPSVSPSEGDAVSPATEAPAEPTAESLEQPAPPPIKEGLVATEPQTVSLASGGPQLVEFFAFW